MQPNRGQDRMDQAETAIPLRRAARYLVGKPKAACGFRRQEHVDKVTVFVDSDFVGDPVSRKTSRRLVAQVAKHTGKSEFVWLYFHCCDLYINYLL